MTQAPPPLPEPAFGNILAILLTSLLVLWQSATMKILVPILTFALSLALPILALAASLACWHSQHSLAELKDVERAYLASRAFTNPVPVSINLPSPYVDAPMERGFWYFHWVDKAGTPHTVRAENMKDLCLVMDSPWEFEDVQPRNSDFYRYCYNSWLDHHFCLKITATAASMYRINK